MALTRATPERLRGELLTIKRYTKRHFTLLCKYIHCVSEKNCVNFFLLELRQISTNVGNFWQKDGKEAKIMQGALNFHHT